MLRLIRTRAIAVSPLRGGKMTCDESWSSISAGTLPIINPYHAAKLLR